MFRVGLTGGIGSGKSTVAERFAALGAGVIDTDLLARELTEPGTPTLARIGASLRVGQHMTGFGPDTIEPGGSLLQNMRRDIESAQARIIEVVRRLEAEGEIDLGNLRENKNATVA